MVEKEMAMGMMCSAASVIMLLEAEDEEKKNRSPREWVKSWRMRRDSKSSFKFLTEELRLEDKDGYRRYIRMDEKCFQTVLNIIEKKIKKQDTLMRLAIPPAEILAVVLRFLATGESYRSMQYQTRLSLAFLSQTIPYICRIIYNEMKGDYLKFPTSIQEWKEIAQNFNSRWQFPLCIGALDGKHVAFRASKQHGALYYNYKGFNSIVLLALADAQYKFIFVDIGCNGRISDGGVLNRSNFRKILEQADKYLPPDEFIGNNRCLPYTIIGDDAFPLEKHIMKPFPYNSLEKEKKIYNFRLSHARQTIEHAFGILSNRFRVLQTKIHLKPEKVIPIVQATCVLHNFLIQNNERYGEPITRTTNYNSKAERGVALRRNHSRVANDIRNNFANYFCQEGALPWQEQYI